jgi:hypothetical protein
MVPIVLDADAVKGTLKEWVATAEVAVSIKRSFRVFLETCVFSRAAIVQLARSIPPLPC